MTVINVWGKIDSVEVIFTPSSSCPDWWNVSVPYDNDGEYICEIWAEDDAGEISYRTAILYITEGRLTTLKYIDGYTLTYQPNEYVLHISSNMSYNTRCL